MRRTLTLGSAGVILLLWAVCVSAVLSSMSTREEFHDLDNYVIRDAILMTQMNYDAAEIRMWTLTYIIRGDVVRNGKTIKEWIQENWTALEKGTRDHLERQQPKGLEEVRNAQAIADLALKLITVSAEIIEAKDRGVETNELFEKVRQEFGAPLFYPLRNALGEHTEAHLGELSVIDSRVHDRHTASIVRTVTLGLSATLLAVLVGFLADRLYVRHTAERKKAQAEIEHLNSVLRAIRNVHRLVTGGKDRDALIRRACNDLVETRGYNTAWLILTDKSGRYEGSAEAGCSEAFQDMVEQYKQGKSPACCRRAEEQAGVVVFENVADGCADCPLAGSCGDQGALAMRLEHGAKPYGFLAVAVPVDMIESAEEQELFEEIGDHIAFSLHGIELCNERKRVEKGLAAEKERLEVTLRSIGDAVITTDAEGTTTMLNRVAEDLTGWSNGEARGRPLTEVFHIVNDKTRERCQNPVEKVIQTGTIVGLANHTVLIARDGTERLLSDSGAPIRDQAGGIMGVILVFRDITDTQRLEEYLSRAQRLDTAGRIAGQIAHDFNNLLGPLVAYPDFIREELDEDHPAVELVTDMEKAAEQMASINQQLLTLGRRGHYNQEPMNLNRIIRDVVHQSQPVPDTLAIEMDLAEDLMNMKGGPSQIHRVVSNLVTNALDAMKNTGHLRIRSENFYADTMSVRFGQVPIGEYVKLTVSDTGCGIHDDVLANIFDPFFTTKVTDKTRGSGLGLSIVNAVVEDHGGYIDLETVVGKSTSFYLYFPVTREAVEAAPSEDHIVGGTERILIVDDDGVQRDVALRMLKRLGYHANAAESGERALEFLRRNPQDLLILDMVMKPGIDGADTYSRALEINPAQKAIVISGYAETDRVEVALKMGAGAFLKKPLSLKTTAAAVREELDRKPEKA